MKTAFVFPGQGSQVVGMAFDLFDGNEAARSVIERADTVLEMSLADIMFGSGDPEQADTDKAILTQTQNTQPALFVHSMAVMSALPKSASRPDMVAGHSLGEYTALAAAGAISFEDGPSHSQIARGANGTSWRHSPRDHGSNSRYGRR